MSQLVSVVIPTWNRHLQLAECIQHIKEQTHKELEIIVVCDGQDPEIGKYTVGADKVVELGRNWSGLDHDSFGIAPLTVGYLMATGTYIMPWCDDERALTKYHIEQLVWAMNRSEKPDFAYPLVQIYRQGNPDNGEAAVIGSVPPRHGQITHYIFKPENFIKFGYPRFKTHPVDWALIEMWLEKGAKYIMVNDLTFEHPLDN